jgi:hypothetical protein
VCWLLVNNLSFDKGYVSWLRLLLFMSIAHTVLRKCLNIYHWLAGHINTRKLRIYLGGIYFRMNFQSYDYIKSKTIISPTHNILSLSSLQRETTTDLRLSFVWLEDRATHRLAPNW